MVHLLGHLIVSVVVVDGDDAGAEGVEGEMVEEKLRPVPEEESDPVAMTVAGGGVTLPEREDERARP